MSRPSTCTPRHRIMMDSLRRLLFLVLTIRTIHGTVALSPITSTKSSYHQMNYKLYTYHSIDPSSGLSSNIRYKYSSLRRSHDQKISQDNDDDNKMIPNINQGDVSPPLSLWKKIKNKLVMDDTTTTTTTNDNATDTLTTSQRLAKMGLSALLSYGFVSNMSLSATVSVAWFSFNKKFGKSPLASGQWKGFLAWYAGFYVVSNFLRPFRVAVSVAISPYFENSIQYIQSKMQVSRPVAISVVVFLANVCGTLAVMSGGIALASLLSGIPVFSSSV